MEKNTAILVNKSISGNLQQLSMLVRKPMVMLRAYYSHILERNLNMRQTWSLLNAQAAFFFAAFPADGPLMLRAACCLWFLHAVMKCRREL